MKQELNRISIMKVYYDKKETKFVAALYHAQGGVDVNKFTWVRNLFDHLVPFSDNPSIKIIFEVVGLGPDYKFYLRLLSKMKHYERFFNEFKLKLGGHSNVVDNKWDADFKKSNLHSTVRGSSHSQRKLRGSNSNVGGQVSDSSQQ